MGFRGSKLEEHALMKHGISSLLGSRLAGALLLGSGLAGALLLGSGCLISFEDTREDGAGAIKDGVGVPRIAAKLSYGDNTCVLPAGEDHVTCDEPVQAWEIMQASVDIEWGNLTPGPIALTPSCSGRYVDPVDDGSAHQEAWHAPLLSNMACELTLETSTAQGPFASAKMYYAVVGGQPPGEVYGAINLEHTSGLCHLLTGDFSEDCDQPVRAGEIALVYVDTDWGKYEPGSVTVRDDCGGTFTITHDNDAGSQSLEWKVPAEPTTCTLELEVNAAGSERRVFELIVPVQ
jgi:hypothetical protein